MNLDESWSKNEINKRWLALLAMRMNFYEEVVGSVQQRNETNENCPFTRTRKMRNKAVLVSVWLKESY
jgi:hypothetical protein